MSKFFSFQIIHFIQPAEFIHQDQLFESFFIQKTSQATADKPCGTCYHNGGRLGHASTFESTNFSEEDPVMLLKIYFFCQMSGYVSTIDSISFSMAVSY